MGCQLSLVLIYYEEFLLKIFQELFFAFISFCSFMFYRGGMLNIFKSLENIARHGTSSTLAVMKTLNINIFLQFFEKNKTIITP